MPPRPIKMNSPKSDIGRSVVFFDGHCNLCSSSVLFILRNDKTRTLYFASLQSAFASKTLKHSMVQGEDVSSIILLEDGEEYRRSEAALRIARHLRSPWRFFWYARFLPKGLRDAVYDFIARHRYRVFGKRESCYVPATDLRQRFLDT